MYLHQFSLADITPTGIDERTGDSPKDKSVETWAIALIVISVLIIVGAIIAFIVIRRRNKRLGEQLVEYNQIDSDTTKGKSQL
jgi:hypothetical protein